MNDRPGKPGTVLVALVLLAIVALLILSIARYFWLDSLNEHYDSLIAAYIAEKPPLASDDLPRLKTQLLEDGIFIKMHRWNRDSFIKDIALYREMVTARDQAQMRREKGNKSTMEIMINL